MPVGSQGWVEPTGTPALRSDFAYAAMVLAEEKSPRRKRLRIDGDAVERRGLVNEFELALKSADDNDAARNMLEFIGSQCFTLEGR